MTSLESPYGIPQGASIYSPNGLYRLFLQMDGNLVGYTINGMVPFWNSGTQNKGYPIIVVRMQSDGNLVIYDYYGAVLWQSGSAVGTHRAPFKLFMQNDRNIVVYDKDNIPIWATMTNVQM